MKAGDTLVSIAAKFNVTVDQLISVNRIKPRNVIFAGQILRISAKTVSLSAVVKAAKNDPDRPEGGATAAAADDVRIIEDALFREGLLAEQFLGEGSFGTETVKAYRCGRCPQPAAVSPAPTPTASPVRSPSDVSAAGTSSR